MSTTVMSQVFMFVILGHLIFVTSHYCMSMGFFFQFPSDTSESDLARIIITNVIHDKHASLFCH